MIEGLIECWNSFESRYEAYDHARSVGTLAGRVVDWGPTVTSPLTRVMEWVELLCRWTLCLAAPLAAVVASTVAGTLP